MGSGSMDRGFEGKGAVGKGPLTAGAVGLA